MGIKKNRGEPGRCHRPRRCRRGRCPRGPGPWRRLSSEGLGTFGAGERVLEDSRTALGFRGGTARKGRRWREAAGAVRLLGEGKEEEGRRKRTRWAHGVREATAHQFSWAHSHPAGCDEARSLNEATGL